MTVTHAAIIREMDAEELEAYYSEQKTFHEIADTTPFESTEQAVLINKVYHQLTGKTITQ